MPVPHLRSRTLRRVHVRVPGGRVSLQYQEKKPGKAQCGSCGVYLKGVPHLLHSQLNRLPKSRKRPERPYGGVLCSRCTRTLLIQQARGKQL